MTEAEWAAASDPLHLLWHLKTIGWNRSGAGRRKLRLVGCACVRRVWRFLGDVGRAQLDMGEQLADGLRPRPTEEEAPPPPFRLGMISGQAEKQARAGAYLT